VVFVPKKIEIIVENSILPLIEPLGYELVDVEYQKEGKDWILRLFIDKDKGIGLDDCQKVSNIISEELDKIDIIPNSYLLEVSSPGIERPLKKKKDFERFKGCKIHISLFEPREGRKKYEGELLGVENDSIEIKITKGTLMVPINQIAKARLLPDYC
jgi:ribosome maturation factor RimP